MPWLNVLPWCSSPSGSSVSAAVMRSSRAPVVALGAAGLLAAAAAAAAAAVAAAAVSVKAARRRMFQHGPFGRFADWTGVCVDTGAGS